MGAKLVVAALMACAVAADADACEIVTGTSIIDAKVSTAGTSAFAVMRTTDPDELVAVTFSGTRKLGLHAGTFELAASASSHLLVTSDGAQAAIVAHRFSAKGDAVGAPITLLPATMQDQRIEAVFFDDRDWVVIVETGSFPSQLWKVVVTTDGKASAPESLGADASLVLPGPTPGTLWIVETRSAKRAWVRGSDGVAGPYISFPSALGMSAATGASGELLLLSHDSDTQDLATLMRPDGTSSNHLIDGSGFWSVIARPDGGYLLLAGGSPGSDVIVGLPLDAAAVPLAAPAQWARGRLRDAAYGHIVWTQIIESPQSYVHQIVLMPVSADGPIGAVKPLASFRQEREPIECPDPVGCADAGGGGAGLLVLLLVLMYVSRGVRTRRQLRRAS